MLEGYTICFANTLEVKCLERRLFSDNIFAAPCLTDIVNTQLWELN